MFRRLLIEDSAAWFTITAFVTALSIYLAFTWRALRMKRDRVHYFEHLPFETDTPATTGGGNARAGARCPPRADRGFGLDSGGWGTSRSTDEHVS
jgi:hypothetical protein